jgi:hypothetical protein
MRGVVVGVLVAAVFVGGAVVLGVGDRRSDSATYTYRSPWSVVGVSKDARWITIEVVEGCGGRDAFDHAEFAGVEKGLEVTVYNRAPSSGDCTDELLVGRHTIKLPRALGPDERITKGCWEGSNGPGCYRYREP